MNERLRCNHSQVDSVLPADGGRPARRGQSKSGGRPFAKRSAGSPQKHGSSVEGEEADAVKRHGRRDVTMSGLDIFWNYSRFS
jgi:hypothetical protein